MSGKFEYRGRLSETPLPRMLATIARYRVPGVFTATRGEIVKKAFLDDGKLIFATSNSLEDSLGYFLVRQGRLTMPQVEESGRRIRESGLRQGEVLIGMGLLRPEEMSDSVLAQVNSIVWSLFDWPDGEVTFEVGRFRAEEKIQIALPIARVIREGLFEHTDAKHVVQVVGPSWTILEPVREALPAIDLEARESGFLALVDGKTPFVDLCRRGPADAATNAKIVYLLLCLDLIRRRPDAGGLKIQVRSGGRGERADATPH